MIGITHPQVATSVLPSPWIKLLLRAFVPTSTLCPEFGISSTHASGYYTDFILGYEPYVALAGAGRPVDAAGVGDRLGRHRQAVSPWRLDSTFGSGQAY
jgi:hypothetical protein